MKISKQDFLFILLLCLQNIVIFNNHIFAAAYFTWDFVHSYFPAAAYVVTSLQSGTIPHWNPFNQAGFPLLVQLQMGVFYPPHLLLALFDIPYTFKVAILIQCAHYLFGTLGMYVFLKKIIGLNPMAFLGAFIFGFNGLYFSNAEHPDIIRAMAWLPWLFYLFTIDKPYAQSIKFSRRYLLIPFFVYCFITGAYPGNFIAGFFILGVYIVFQSMEFLAPFIKNSMVAIGFRPTLAFIRLIKLPVPQLLYILGFFGLIGLGISMSMINIGPALFNSRFLVRAEDFNTQAKAQISMDLLPGLFLSNRYLPGEISMSSLYITLPGFFFAFFVKKEDLKKNWEIIAVGLLSLLMVFGANSVVWKILTSILHPLEYSRMVSSDYRAPLLIILILLITLGIKTLVEGKIYLGPVRLIIAALIALQFFYTTYFLQDPAFFKIRDQHFTPFVRFNLSQPWVYWGLAFLTLILTSALIVWFLKRPSLGITLPVMFLILTIVSLDALRVLPDMGTWGVNGNFNADPELAVVRDTNYLQRNPPVSRPARDNKYFLWTNYLRGQYESGNGFLPCIIIQCREINSKKYLENYMALPWSPILLEAGDLDPGAVSLQIERLKIFIDLGKFDDRVKQVEYGNNEIRYRVTLDHPMLLVENEVYFPGWQAVLMTADQDITIQVVQINKALRGWFLPPGKYNMVTRFSTPYYNFSRNISIAAFMIWLVILLISFNVLQKIKKLISKRKYRV